jgi:lysophospholipid acyltransferase (LPLAT)-like uncharacterized protein
MATPAAVKTLSRSHLARALACRTGRGLIRAARATGRWDVVGEENVRPYWDGKPAVVCFWHGRLMMLPYAWRSTSPFHMLISAHPDGQLIARIVEGLGIQTLAGSSRRGGSEGFRTMVRLIKGGATVGITPDGPRGPRMRASEGAVALARLSGAPLLPVAFGARRRRVLKSWDRFVVALPFSDGVFVWGAPIEVARDADADALERARLKLEESLNFVTDEADRRTGQARIEPAPLPSEARP